MSTLIVHGVMVISTDKYFQDWISKSGRLDHDQYVLGKIKFFLGDSDILDIGANIGTHTIFYLSNKLPGSKVYAFEPNPISFKCLSYNCPEAIRIPMGVSTRPEIFNLNQNIENPGAVYLSNLNNQDAIAVPSIALDSFLFENISFIKIDVEGFEVNVLKGALNTIVNNKPNLWVEITPPYLRRAGSSLTELLDLMRDINYVPLFAVGDSAQSDVMFVHVEKLDGYSDLMKSENYFNEFKDWEDLLPDSRFNKIIQRMNF
jgi:FkbM family methyltransferase